MLRFLAAEVSARAGFWLVVILAATPILAVGCTLLTVDAPSVFFWVAAFVCGWRAIQSGGPGYWCGLGICLGLGFLSKYTAVAQIPSFILFFLLYPPARRHLRRPGPYLALALASLAFLPVLWWNYRHGWITLTHLYERGGLDHAWRFQWRMPVEFLGAELGLLNPIFCVAMIGSAMFCWRNARRGPLVLYLFTMGAPLFLFYTLYTLRARVQPNWIAPAVVPLFALMVIDGEQRWEAGEKNVGRLLTAGLVVGFLLVGFLHATEITQWVTGRPLPIALDPMRRVRGWGDIARMMEAERVKLSQEGKPVFFIVHDYWTAAVLTFYLPEAKRGVPDQPIVYCPASDHPENQFYFWPSYTGRKGQDALYIRETDDPMPIPGTVSAGFRSVTDLGMRDALYHGQVFRRFQLFKCQELR
jgi:4-amino-4-deoxy-L-arabinose transferase-like glycosyltransferase